MRNETLCAICYNLLNLENVKNTHEGVLRLVPATLLKILLHGCFSRFFKLCKWYQIAERITYRFLIGEKQKPIRSLNTDVRYVISTQSVNQLQYHVIMLNDLPYPKLK